MELIHTFLVKKILATELIHRFMEKSISYQVNTYIYGKKALATDLIDIFMIIKH